MSYLVTVKTKSGATTYRAIGNRDALMDQAYDNGAMGVTVMVLA